MIVENNEIKMEDPSVKTAAPDSGELERLRAERDELKDLVLRRTAEFDNFRKRSERDRTDYVAYAAADMVKDLLPILDDFERALKVENANSDYAKGVEMIYNRMFDVMKKQGLEPVDAVGKPFDPHLHQAIERVETDEAEDHTVLGEFQRGYNFKGRLLRPAMVRVAVKP